ncbi:uncharacterized protein LOC107981256 [Nasonia vitripennis]|uniref:Uncharacterized protein n=1 Tax=Nasonia vitripennis TaxID=7425 RepID=A0A7M7Q527_NASVI|nr:uncharacterized protein LOC107981256 [Nasonia vitripennis]
MIRKTRIDWSHFTKVRNSQTNVIEAAMCNDCQALLETISQTRLHIHRDYCKSRLEREGAMIIRQAEDDNENVQRCSSPINDNEEEYETEEDINNFDIETQKYLIDKKLAMFFF